MPSGCVAGCLVYRRPEVDVPFMPTGACLLRILVRQRQRHRHVAIAGRLRWKGHRSSICIAQTSGDVLLRTAAVVQRGGTHLLSESRFAMNDVVVKDSLVGEGYG